MGAIAVDQPGLRIRQVTVPDLVGAFGQVEAPQFLAAARVKDAQLDAGGVGREYGEIHAQAIAGGAKRIRLTGGETGELSGVHGFSLGA
ncbi:hypothetical protein D3C87_1736330 [compost metagenome]